jgi:hypothetical protein
MIDPLAAAPKPSAPTRADLFSVLGDLANTVIAGGRFLTADMTLIGDKDIFSRFQLVPLRRGGADLGEDALAGSALGALGGFCCRAFRVHDFLLGRANMQFYLRSELVLKGDNKLFNNWTDDQRKDFAVDGQGQRIDPSLNRRAEYYLPIIPDRTEVPFTDEDPDWPANALDPRPLRGPFKTRVEAVLKKARQQELPGILAWVASEGLINLLAGPIAEAIVKQLSDDLRKKKLSA